MNKFDTSIYQSYDQVVKTTKYRYKMSKASGNEWRSKWDSQYFLKGVDVTYAVKHIYDNYNGNLISEEFDFNKLSKIDQSKIMECCYQKGCSELYTRIYRLKYKYFFLYSYDKKVEKTSTDLCRCFCERHATRGDCSLEDSDDNYEQIEGPEGPSLGAKESDISYSGIELLDFN